MPFNSVVIPKQHPLQIVRQALEKLDSFGQDSPAMVDAQQVIELLAYLSASAEILQRSYDAILKEMERIDPTFQAHGQFVDTGGEPILKLKMEKGEEEIH